MILATLHRFARGLQHSVQNRFGKDCIMVQIRSEFAAPYIPVTHLLSTSYKSIHFSPSFTNSLGKVLALLVLLFCISAYHLRISSSGKTAAALYYPDGQIVHLPVILAKLDVLHKLPIFANTPVLLFFLFQSFDDNFFVVLNSIINLVKAI